MPKPEESRAALYLGIPLVFACVYFGGYVAVRSLGLLNRHAFGSEGVIDFWVSGPLVTGGGKLSDRFKENSAPLLEAIFRPICRAEGEFWTWKYSGEDEELLMMPLPSR
jgi:hypothetical protein